VCDRFDFITPPCNVQRASNTAQKDSRGHYRVARLKSCRTIKVVSPLLHLYNNTADRIATSRTHTSAGLVSVLENTLLIIIIIFLIVFHPSSTAIPNHISMRCMWVCVCVCVCYSLYTAEVPADHPQCGPRPDFRLPSVRKRAG